MYKFSKFVLTLLALVWMSACGQDHSSSANLPTPTPSQTTLNGVVAANLVSKATVSAYSVLSDGTPGQLLGSTETNASGDYSLVLTGASGMENVLLVASGGIYVDEATGSNLTLDSMEAFSSSMTTQRINVTPISSAVWSSAKNLLTEQNLTQAFSSAKSAAQTYVGADINADFGASLAEAIDKNDTASMSNWLMLTAMSKYQADNNATFRETISALSTEMSSGYPVYTLDGMPSSTIAGSYFQVLQDSNISVSRFDSSQVAFGDCGTYDDFTVQLATTPFAASSWSGASWGPSVASFSDQTVCKNYLWQRKRVMYAYENIAVTSKWNYCHHHSASWFPGKRYSYDLNDGAQNNSSTLEKSLYCSANSFYDTDGKRIAGYESALDFRDSSKLSVINNAYRWNSTFAQTNLLDYNETVSNETEPEAMGSFLAKLYPHTKGTLIDTSWFDYNKTSGTFTLEYAANLSRDEHPSGTYPRQSKNQFLNGLDCSDLSGWAYRIGLKEEFSTAINAQAGQPLAGHFANATAQQLCLNKSEQTEGAAGDFLTYNGHVIDASLLEGNKTSPILNMLAPGDLLFITPDANSTHVTHVITWTGKKVAKAGSGVTDTTVALDLIAPSIPGSGTGRLIGDWVIIDSHYQGADYRDFSGWYVDNLWGVRRVIGAKEASCVSGEHNSTTEPLSSSDINLIFVVSPDVNYSDKGDVHESTANLTNQGLNRSLKLASYLKQTVLGDNNVTRIYALQPISYIQNGHPYMASLSFIQQFAMLNPTTLSISDSNTLTAYSTPIKVSYSPHGLPTQSVNLEEYNQSLAGLSFGDINGSNELVTSDIVSAKKAGYYVFSAPWQTTIGVMEKVKKKYGYNIELPSKFQSSNTIYAIAIKADDTKSATLKTYKADIVPDTSYPTLPKQIATNVPCSSTYFDYNATMPKNSNINKNQTVYFIRHAEAHPDGTSWDDGNYIATGQWRSLLLPTALEGKIEPSMVVSTDPSQIIGAEYSDNASYVRPSLTAQPYAIANNLPFYVIYGSLWSDVGATIEHLFYDNSLSGKTVLVAWEHWHIELVAESFLSSSHYFDKPSSSYPKWGYDDYDSIWTFTLDGDGNLNVKNNLCEGIDSSELPILAPIF